MGGIREGVCGGTGGGGGGEGLENCREDSRQKNFGCVYWFEAGGLGCCFFMYRNAMRGCFVFLSFC